MVRTPCLTRRTQDHTWRSLLAFAITRPVFSSTTSASLWTRPHMTPSRRHPRTSGIGHATDTLCHIKPRRRQRTRRVDPRSHRGDTDASTYRAQLHTDLRDADGKCTKRAEQDGTPLREDKLREDASVESGSATPHTHTRTPHVPAPRRGSC